MELTEGQSVSEATLLVLQGVDQGARFTVGEEEVGIGRGARNGIRILDTEVSRSHASLRFDEHGFVVTDRGSSNGTFVNGAAVRSQMLNNGDQIQVGRTVLVFSQTAGRQIEKPIVDQVDLINRHDPQDRSSIVAEVDSDAGRRLLEQTAVDPDAAARVVTNLQTLYRISEEAVSPSVSRDELLQRILELTIQVVGADRGCVLVTNPETGQIEPEVFSHRRGVDGSTRMPVSRTIVDYVLAQDQGVRTTNARTDRRFEPGQSIVQAGIREAMCVPMQGHYELLGVIYVDITTPPERALLEGETVSKFGEDQLRLLVAIGRQSALAIENFRFQQALLKAERLAAVGQTIATLSHHIKNILQGVRGGSYLIDRGLNDHQEDMVRKGWNIVEKNQSKIYHLVMDMLTFSTERQPALEGASLNETVADVCELMQARADECEVTLDCRPASNAPDTVFDPEGIHRALLNVVINAIDAVEGTPQGEVVVDSGYDSESDRIFVVVSDNGPGIAPDQLPKVFNVFESTKGARGTGLGLAVSRKIIREHGGEILVESTIGQGSRFTLTWPRLDEDPAPDGGQTITGNRMEAE